MTRTNRNRRVMNLAAPHLLTNELVTATGVVWAVSTDRPARLLFRGRHQRWLALTDRRLLLFDRRRRHGLMLAKSWGGLRLERSRRTLLLRQLLIDGGADRLLVLEFRPREHALGDAVARALQADAGIGAVVGAVGDLKP